MGRTLTVAEVADRYRIHYSTVYRLIREGKLYAFRVGDVWRVDEDALLKWEKGLPHANEPRD